MSKVDKTIKELKRVNYQKKHQYELLEIRYHALDSRYIQSKEEIERLKKENKLLQDMDKILRNENTNLKLEIERLNNIIKQYDKISFIHELELQKRVDKATEYIDNHSKYLGDNDYLWDLTTDETSELVNILKGVNKE